MQEPSSQPPAKQKPTPERRYVARSVNAFVQWMPLGGSVAAFISFCFQQSWAQALMMFPVTAVTGVWAAYSKNFVEQLQTIYAERGKTDAHQFVAFLDSLNETAKWRFSGTTGHYLKLVANHCRDYTTEGFRPAGSIPLLEDVFVPLQLSNELLRGAGGEVLPMRPSLDTKGKSHLSQQDAGEVERQLRRRQEKGISIWELLREVRRVPAYRQLTILAWGGYGKTTLMRNLTYTFAKGRHRKHKSPKLIPFLIYLRDWREILLQEKPPNLPTLITNHYIPTLPNGESLKLPPNWAVELLRKGDALVIFDGFDEVEEKPDSLSNWISQQMREYDESNFILTSRPGGYARYSAEKPRSEVRIHPFNAKQRKQFITNWYLCQERYRLPGRKKTEIYRSAHQEATDLLNQFNQRQELQEMGQNPLLLNMILTFHRSFPGTELPQHRWELYREICQIQLGARPLARNINLLLPAQESQEKLQELAFRMQECHLPTITRQDALSILKSNFKSQKRSIKADKFLDHMVEVSEVLVEKEANNYEFLHLSFQAYLAAGYVHKNKEEEASLITHWPEDWWRETILLYAAHKNPCSIVEQAIQHHGTVAADLGYEILRESSWDIDAALERNVKQLRYSQLEQLLVAQKWYEADLETYRLLVKTANKEKFGILWPDDLIRLPSWDLLKLDELWKRHSEGKFSFSIQKKIWNECGCPFSGFSKDWEEFSNKVHWGKPITGLSYQELKPGHFPRRWRCSSFNVHLFSRKDL